MAFTKLTAALLLLHGATAQKPPDGSGNCLTSGYSWNADGALTQKEWNGYETPNTYPPAVIKQGFTKTWSTLMETLSGTNEAKGKGNGIWTIDTIAFDDGKSVQLFDETYTLLDVDGDLLVFRGVYPSASEAGADSDITAASTQKFVVVGANGKYAGATEASVTFNDDAARTRAIEVCVPEQQDLSDQEDQSEQEDQPDQEDQSEQEDQPDQEDQSEQEDQPDQEDQSEQEDQPDQEDQSEQED